MWKMLTEVVYYIVLKAIIELHLNFVDRLVNNGLLFKFHNIPLESSDRLQTDSRWTLA
jgi:hypothetical protein